MSADGRVVMGNYGTASMMGGGEVMCWVLRTVDRDIVIPATPDGLTAKSDNLHEVRLAWNKDEADYEGLTLEKYNGTDLVTSVPLAEGNTLACTLKDVTPGYPVYTVTAVFKAKDGSTVESPRSNEAKVAVAETYALPLSDNFDSGSLETNYWTTVEISGDASDCTWGALDYMGMVDKGLYGSATMQMPYSSALVSRPMDATAEEHVALSFAAVFGYINATDWDLTKDSLSIDVSTDKGATWNEVAGLAMEDFATNWGVHDIDLSEAAAGKVFQLRLRRHGQGAAMYSLTIDVLKVTAKPEKEAPEGLTGTATGDGLDLIWKSAADAYQLNYINGYASSLLVIGDEGKEFIAANSFGKDELAAYKGKYMTSVSAFINHDSGIQGSKDTKAKVVVFADGKLVREQEMENIKYNKENVVVLDEPLLIDGTQEIKAGLKIYDYDPAQMPITYQNTVDFVPGKSDLYSQDGGKTWLKLSDFYAGQGFPEQGYCNWYISANMTDGTSAGDKKPEADDNLMGYNVFRDGKRLNKVLIASSAVHYTDEAPVDNASYTVVAYYYDGSVSAVSESYNPGIISSVENAVNDSEYGFTYDSESGTVRAGGDVTRITLHSVSGMAVASAAGNVLQTGNLPAGVYVLQIEGTGKTVSKKIFIGK